MGRTKRVHIALTAAALVGSGACGLDAGPSAGSVQVVDSAGVRVVRNGGPAWEAGEAWLVDAEPEGVIGTLEGPPETRFFGIADAIWRSDGGVVVADGGSGEIRAFDARGTHLWTHGRQGDGPGEYRSPAILLPLTGDSVAVYDSRARRISIVGPGGEFIRSVVPEPPAGVGMAAPRAVLTPGLWVSSGGARFGGGEAATTGTVAPPMPLYLARPDGTVLDSVTSLGTGARLVQQSARGVSVWTVPFSVGTALAGGGGRLVTAEPTAPGWTARDSTGQVVQVVSFPSEGRPVEDEDWDAALEAALDGDDDPGLRRRATEAFEAMDRPARWPILEDVVMDGDGNVWIQRFAPPGVDGEPTRWWVFTGPGRLLGEVSLPGGLEVEAIDGDRILGVATDDVGVERIQVHRIRRPDRR